MALEKLKYQNHLNEVVDFGVDGIFVNSSELHDYEWSYTKKNDRITGFSRSIVKRKLPIVICCETEADAVTARNKLLAVFERDILADSPGKIVIGDYYFPCFAIKSTKKSYLLSRNMMTAELTLVSDNPVWVKESVSTFPISSSVATGFSYPHDFPYGYTSRTASNQLINDGIGDSNFRLVIFGAVQNPSVSIDGHTYRVNCTVNSGEYLTIDSANKEIYLTSSSGTKTNKFADRYRASYVFEKIKPGANAVSWSGDFALQVVLLDERSEPKWT